MNHNDRTIITKRLAHRAGLRLTVVLLAFATQVIAHAGFDHVIGTVVKLENSVLTVKTAKGDVDMKLNESTEITKNDQKAQVSDLKPGTRVAVDVPVGSKDRLAHSIKVGVSGAVGAHAHSPQK